MTIENIDNRDLLCIWEADNDCEWMCSYLVNANGSFTWNGNIYLEQQVKEELPATIRDEKHLRDVLKFIAASI